MSAQYKIKEMDEKIKLLRKTAEELLALGGEIEAVKKNLSQHRSVLTLIPEYLPMEPKWL